MGKSYLISMSIAIFSKNNPVISPSGRLVLNRDQRQIVRCLPGAKIEAITERVENTEGSGKGGSVFCTRRDK